MKLQKGNIIRTIKNKDIAEQLIKECGYKEIKEKNDIKNETKQDKN